MSEKDQFYSKFLPFYDKLISYENRKKRETPFWRKLFDKYHIRDAHDCSCGTGHHLLLFHELGICCSGSDLSEDMIHVARKKCKERNLKCNIFQADFRKLESFIRSPVDLIVNLGNSLAHLSNEVDILNHLNGCYKSLSSKGILVIDTRNYDYLLKEKPRFIPLSFREDHGFIYVLDYLKESIKFNILFFDLKNKDFQTFSTIYYPILYKKLIDYLRESGFEVENQYGNYNFEEFDINTSSNLIIVTKPKSRFF
ncbi:MAG: class I SAM-dependent methyltransferase [Candidatus Hodarchaeota archaeon]